MSGGFDTPESLDALLATLHVGEVLDVGCGAGEFTLRLARSLGSYSRITAIDTDKDSIDEARRLLVEAGGDVERKVRYRILSAYRMTFVPGRFDLAAISDALHHLADPDAVLRGMLVATRQGGRLLVHEQVCDGLDAAQANRRDVHRLKARVDASRGLSHGPTHTRAEVEAMVARLAVCIEHRLLVASPDPGLAARLEAGERAVAFMESYLAHAPRELRAGFGREAAAIGRRIHGVGTAPPPQLLILARVVPS